MYGKNSIRVVVNNNIGANISQRVGLPEGDKLSPLLFSLFIADLSAKLAETQGIIIFYVDDLDIASCFS